MKTLKVVFFIMALALVWGAASPALALPNLVASAQSKSADVPATPSQNPAATVTPNTGVVPILTCPGTGTGGDLADLRGIRFTVSQSFGLVVVRMQSDVSGGYAFTAELRRSTNFTGPADYTRAMQVALTGTVNTTPYISVPIDFGAIPVSGSETFSLKFTGFSGPGTVYFEVFGIGNTPCPNMDETDDTVTNPPVVRGDPAGLTILSDNYNSNYVTTAPNLDGAVGFGEWKISNEIPFHSGFITMSNDNIRLYILIDVTSETANDPHDFFYVTFDTNQDGKIDANIDQNYGVLSNTNMRYQYYLGPNVWTGVLPDTYSARAKGFGCFWGDFTFHLISINPVRFSCSQHRVWELAIDLAEIGAHAGGTVHMGIMAGGSSPAFQDYTPANFTADFSHLINVNLAPSPFFTLAPFPGAAVVFQQNGIEITQATQHPDNSLSLVANKDTVARLYAVTANVIFPEMARMYLYGSTTGVDLPGSPLAASHVAPTGGVNRNSLNATTNFSLPGSWTQGTVDFSAKSVDLLGNKSTSSLPGRVFSTRTVPTYWIVPLNTGTAGSPVLPPQSEIERQKSYLKAIYPLANVVFVQKPWQAVGVTSEGNAITDLNNYYNNTVFAWVISVIFTGVAPFTLPDQIYGFLPTGGGLSDPVWAGGAGRVARGFQGTSLEGTMAHEINHNLDRSATGTWGRHVPNDCGALGPDPSWPYPDFRINEVGFDTRLPWSAGGSTLTVIPATDPDIMSYCQSGHLPTKWISPYRWSNLFNVFAPAVAQATQAEIKASISQPGQDFITITGSLTQNPQGAITGKLNPVFVQPGILTQNPAQGRFAVRLLDPNGGMITGVNFNAEFLFDPEEPTNNVYFNFTIPEPAGVPLNVARIVLVDTSDNSTLDTINVPPETLTVSVTAPAAGATWSGTQTIEWTATNAAADTFNIVFSKDNGANWDTIVTGLKGVTSYAVDTATLPNTSVGIFRVVANDGFHTVEADSGVITISNVHIPTVDIFTPTANQFVQAGTPVQLSGDGTDVQDGALPDNHLIWRDGSNVIATGRNASVDLAPGWHTLTLTGTNSTGGSKDASVMVFVGYQLHLPGIYR